MRRRSSLPSSWPLSKAIELEPFPVVCVPDAGHQQRRGVCAELAAQVADADPAVTIAHAIAQRIAVRRIAGGRVGRRATSELRGIVADPVEGERFDGAMPRTDPLANALEQRSDALPVAAKHPCVQLLARRERVIRCQFDDTRECRCGLVVALQIEQRGTAVEPALRIIAARSDGTLEARERFLRLAEVALRDAEIVEDAGVPRPQPDRPLEMGERLGGTMLREQDAAAIVERVDVAGSRGEHARVLRERLVGPVERDQRVAAPEAGVSIVGVERKRPLEAGERVSPRARARAGCRHDRGSLPRGSG